MGIDDRSANRQPHTDTVGLRGVESLENGSDPRTLINTTARLLSRRGLRMWRKRAKTHTKSKLKIKPRDEPQEVTVLPVNARTAPTVSRRKRDAIRAAIFELRDITDKAERERVIQHTAGSSMCAHSTQVLPPLYTAIS